MSSDSKFSNQDVRKMVDKFFGEGFPFADVNANKMSEWLKDSNWVQQIVQDTLQKAMPKLNPNDTEQKEQIVETTRSVLVQVPLTPKTNLYSLRLYVSSTTVRIEGLPGGIKRVIKLPREVNLVGIRAVCKDNQLEIRLPKRTTASKERQINITVE